MELNEMPSFIKQLIQEAEDFTLSPEPEPELGGSPMADLNLPTPPNPQSAGAPALPPVSMPQPDASAPTAVTKTVINADLVLTHLSELKSIINNYEKRFGGEDIGVDDARVYISSFLNAMAYHSEKLQSFLNIPTNDKPEPEMPLNEEPPIEEPSLDLGLEAPSEDTGEEVMPEDEINTDFDLSKTEDEGMFGDNL